MQNVTKTVSQLQHFILDYIIHLEDLHRAGGVAQPVEDLQVYQQM
jgi:hypothetical protein